MTEITIGKWSFYNTFLTLSFCNRLRYSKVKMFAAVGKIGLSIQSKSKNWHFALIIQNISYSIVDHKSFTREEKTVLIFRTLKLKIKEFFNVKKVIWRPEVYYDKCAISVIPSNIIPAHMAKQIFSPAKQLKWISVAIRLCFTLVVMAHRPCFWYNSRIFKSWYCDHYLLQFLHFSFTLCNNQSPSLQSEV